MNTKYSVLAALGCVLVVVSATVSFAEEFESRFVIVKALGDCGAKAPASASFIKAADGSKHEYGTVVKTGRKSSAILQFSQFNGCRIYARSAVAVTEEMRNKRLKVLKLEEPGKVQVKLDPSFRKHNDLKVETPSAVCGAIGCNFTIEYKIIADLRTTIISCAEGEVAIAGSCFLMSGIEAGSQVTVAKSPQGNFIRIKQVSGTGTITVRDENGDERDIPLEAGDEIRIMAQASEVDETELILIYEFRYADEEKGVDTWEVIVGDTDTHVILPGAWPNITVVTPEPEDPTPTPVGKRGDEGTTGTDG